MMILPGPETGRAGSLPRGLQERLPGAGGLQVGSSQRGRGVVGGQEEGLLRWPPTLRGRELRLGRARWDGDEVPDRTRNDRGPGTPDAGRPRRTHVTGSSWELVVRPRGRPGNC
ncbi:unnamed protein product [Gulo gulo]|uniref:Uncharacterized protein n=1 Tax=Gulo gulo TaxID=48420 RepID=A0A9X9M956_GULGU|nr:unnamed protein product [Gulo gulo]